MTEPHREKTPVLCGVKITTRDRGSTVEYLNFVAVSVEFPDQVEDALKLRMRDLRLCGQWPGLFVSWEWVTYLPKTGRPSIAGRFLPN